MLISFLVSQAPESGDPISTASLTGGTFEGHSAGWIVGSGDCPARSTAERRLNLSQAFSTSHPEALTGPRKLSGIGA